MFFRNRCETKNVHILSHVRQFHVTVNTARHVFLKSNQKKGIYVFSKKANEPNVAPLNVDLVEM